MTAHINDKNKQGITNLASLIKQAGFAGVKVTVKRNKSIILTPRKEVYLSAGLADLKAERYVSFKSLSDAAAFLDKRSK